MTVCHQCNKVIKRKKNSITTGYGTDRDGHKICFKCIGRNERLEMNKSDRATLYLTVGQRGNSGPLVTKVTNWPSSLVIYPYASKDGRHNIAQTRKDVWFITKFFGKVKHWHGVRYGNYTDILHCKQVKG